MKYRTDIDGLRALAVLSVVTFHAFPAWMTGGFIGVDVFFVISGFLISTIIFESLNVGEFSFHEFYARRIKRIFPALLLVLIASYAFGWFILFADEYKQLGKHIAGAAAFVSNFVLWSEAGYFDKLSETKPLLHLWSLGIEEQFYILWPFVLWFAWKRKFSFLALTIVVSIASLIFNLKGVQQDTVAAFYSPQTRFWELLSGSTLAGFAIYKKDLLANYKSRADIWLVKIVYNQTVESNEKLSNFASSIGFLLLVYGFLKLTKDLNFPGIYAVIPVIGTSLIILAGPNAWINRKILSNKIAVWFGLISFPLYLWHWPLLSFARIIYNQVLSYEIRVAAVALSIVLAWLTYRFVERPIRFGKGGKSKATILVVAMVVVGFLGYGTYKSDGFVERSIVTNNRFLLDLEWPYWTDQECADRYNVSPCQVSNSSPQLMIIGDSHGNHLYPGLVAALRSNLGVYSGGTCTPVQGIKIYVNNNPGHPCKVNNYLPHNFKILDNNPSIETVVISSHWRPVLDGKTLNAEEGDGWSGLRVASIYPEESGLSAEDLIYKGLKRTILKLLDRKVDILFVRDTPDFDVDIRDLCAKRFSSFDANDCRLPRDLFDLRKVRENRLVERLKSDFPSLKVFDPFNIFCNSIKCDLVIDSNPLYRDNHHLSKYGSELLGKAIASAHFSHLVNR